jgi:hypothetical protein
MCAFQALDSCGLSVGASATGCLGVSVSFAEEVERFGHEQVVVLEDAAVARVRVDTVLPIPAPPRTTST